MIVESDNDAMFALIAKHREEVLDVYRALKLPDPNTDPDDFMSPKSYSAVFRTLFNSTYLRRELSEQALKLLTETTFKDGLVAGIEDSTLVAHKFGVYAGYDEKGETQNELHDCGIVYFPENPYFICVMTKGRDFNVLTTVIKDLSRIAYEGMLENNSR